MLNTMIIKSRDQNELPYNDLAILSSDNPDLKNEGIEREACDRVAFRGDDQSMKDINQVF